MQKSWQIWQRFWTKSCLHIYSHYVYIYICIYIIYIYNIYLYIYIYIYWLQEELIHFGQRIFTNFDLDVWKHFGLKNHTRKVGKIRHHISLGHNISQNISLYISQNVAILPNHILQRTLKAFLPLLSTFPITLFQFCQLFATP